MGRLSRRTQRLSSLREWARTPDHSVQGSTGPPVTVQSEPREAGKADMPPQESKPHLEAHVDQLRTAGISQPLSVQDTESNDASVAANVIDASNGSRTLHGVESQPAAAPGSVSHTAEAVPPLQPSMVQDERPQSRDELPAGRPEAHSRTTASQPAMQFPPASADVASSLPRPRSHRGARRDFAKLLKTATFQAPFYRAPAVVAPPEGDPTLARSTTSSARRAVRVRQRYARDASSWQMPSRHHRHKVQPLIKG